MANVTHSSLTGVDLHESKGVASAALNTVYVADGVGSGTWQASSTFLAFSGMIADFATPVAPSGWLECDGSLILRTGANAGLFAALAIQQSGTRSTVSKHITGLADTSNMFPGYFIGGPGIPAATTITSVDNSTQITISAFPTSNGTSVYAVGPYSMGDGSTNFRIPDAKSSGRYRRSRTAVLSMGTLQADQFIEHGHTVNSGGNLGLTGIQNADHKHSTTLSGNTGAPDQDHTHGYNKADGSISVNTTSVRNDLTNITVLTGASNTFTSTASGGASLAHVHAMGAGPFTSDKQDTDHRHSVTVNNAGVGNTETRPISFVVMTCIKL